MLARGRPSPSTKPFSARTPFSCCLLPPEPQWLKTYFDQHTGGQAINGYDPAARRALCKTGDVRGGAGSAGSVASSGRGAAPAGAGVAGGRCAGTATPFGR